MNFIMQCVFISSITERLEENESVFNVGKSFIKNDKNYVLNMQWMSIL